jgi:uncharacterized protein YebE (UPF0316 family)
MPLLDSDLYTYLLLPLLIIMARIVDVSIGTLKIILMARGNKTLAPILGFFEVLVWLLAVTRIFENLNNWVCYLAYAFGFALGSFVGIKLEEKLALGYQLIRIITRKEATLLTKALRDSGCGVTYIPAEGSTGKVGILYSVVQRKSIAGIIPVIKEHNPNAFYTIEDIRFVSQPAREAFRKKRQTGDRH